MWACFIQLFVNINVCRVIDIQIGGERCLKTLKMQSQTMRKSQNL